MVGFNTQPPEGSWQQLGNGFERHRLVSTHSRPKAAGLPAAVLVRCRLCFNTQPPEGGWSRSGGTQTELRLFQHTAARRRLDMRNAVTARPIWFQHTAARRRLDRDRRPESAIRAGFNTQPPEGGWRNRAGRGFGIASFQHTAARRRLGRCFLTHPPTNLVSTHSRPKAAG